MKSEYTRRNVLFSDIKLLLQGPLILCHAFFQVMDSRWTSSFHSCPGSPRSDAAPLVGVKRLPFRMVWDPRPLSHHLSHLLFPFLIANCPGHSHTEVWSLPYVWENKTKPAKKLIQSIWGEVWGHLGSALPGFLILGRQCKAVGCDTAQTFSPCYSWIIYGLFLNIFPTCILLSLQCGNSSAYINCVGKFRVLLDTKNYSCLLYL